MKIPGPDHPIVITPNPNRVRILAGGIVIADTTAALAMAEAHYAVVLYIPREDANMALLTRTERATRCPYKGEASYYSIAAGGQTLDDAVWSYEHPYPAMTAINGHLAFYPDKVVIEEVPAAAQPATPGRS